MAKFWPFFFFFGHVWPYIGHIWPWEALFFHRCARRDGGRAGRRADVARIDEKNGQASTLDSIFRPCMVHI